MPPLLAVDTVHYKIFICGKSGVGKTALAARLAGINIPNMHYETKGTSLLCTNTAGSVCDLKTKVELHRLFLKELRQRWCIGQRNLEKVEKYFSSVCSCGTVEKMHCVDLTISFRYVSVDILQHKT